MHRRRNAGAIRRSARGTFVKENIFILVKTYPTISSKHDELVCTAGVRETGEWVRIYPVPFRKLDWGRQYKKHQWIRAALQKNPSDNRPESFRPISDIEPRELVPAKHQWAARREILSRVRVYDDMQSLIAAARQNLLSLAMFKPRKITGFFHEETEREWSPEKLRQLEERARQIGLFQDSREFVREFKVVKKLPYKCSYQFADANGNSSKLMISDWEIGMLFWNCLRKAGGDEQAALRKVRQKCEVDLPGKDLHLILGTTHQFHKRGKNPFIIIGLYYPPALSPSRGENLVLRA